MPPVRSRPGGPSGVPPALTRQPVTPLKHSCSLGHSGQSRSSLTTAPDSVLTGLLFLAEAPPCRVPPCGVAGHSYATARSITAINVSSPPTFPGPRKPLPTWACK